MEKHFYNLTNPQNSIWLTNQMYPNTAIGNICGTVFIDEKVDFSILEKSINTFVQKNDSFRIILEHTENGVEQYVSDFAPFKLETRKIKSKGDVSELEKELVSCPFSLTGNLLFKFVAFEFPDGTGGFIMNAHHLIVDAWTVGITLNGIIEHYEYYSGKRDEIPDKYPSYIDYINSEKAYLESEKYGKDKEYWNTQFNQVPDVAKITGTKQDLKDDCQASRIEFNISKDLVEKINEYCKINKSSIFTFSMAIYGIYLNRVSGLDEFTVGTPILNRINYAEKQTTGMFVSTVPFKYSIKNDDKFTDYLSNITIGSMGMLRHQKYPYSHLLESLRKIDYSTPNLYDIAISYQNIRSNKQTAQVKYHTKWNFNNCLTDSLNIHIYDTDDTGSLDVAYDYRTSIYSENDISQLNQRILHLVKQVIENPDVKLSELEIVTPEEKQKILYEFNDTKMDYPKDKTIAELFEEQVKKTPDNIAVVFKEKPLTYKELNEKANSLANYLNEKCIGTQNVIGIYMNKSIDYIISILAVLKTANIFLPISALHPKDRIEYILKNSNAKVLISNSKFSNNIIFSNSIINFDDLPLDSNCDNLKTNSKPTDLAYILYTSGSTGNPKGVTIQNYSLINHVFAVNKKFNNAILPSDKCLSIANISFDANIQEIFIPILLGASLHVLPDDSIYDIKSLAEYIANNKITFAFIPPNILDSVYDVLNNFDDINLNKLLVGVEKIKYSTLNKFLSLNKNMQIHNGYGPTEATICCVSYMYSNENKSICDGFVPIGSPLANNKILIIDSHTKKIQPSHVEGEIIVLGDQVSNGYTDASLNNVFFSCDYYDEKAYSTGDFGYYTNDGCIVFTGRKDDQIKLNGHRIELEEIETLISKYPQVEKAIVAKQTINNKDYITAYYVSKETNIIEELKKYLKKYLPQYMIPSYFLALESFPLTSNGKIDKKKLPVPEIVQRDKNIVLPRNETDSRLINLLKNILNINSISIDDSFFDLGGDSLSAISLCAQIQNEFNVQIYAKDILENPKVKELSDIIANSINKSINMSIASVAKANYYPVSPAQKRIYFASNIAGSSNILYNLPGSIIFDGKIDNKKLEKCINQLINRHESLRTYFEVNEGIVVQKIIDEIDYHLDFIEKQSYDNLHSLFIDFVKPFDLTKAPLFRAQLLSFTNNKYALFIDMHHIICDGASSSILIDELCKLYNGESLPDIKITYKDYAIFENKRIASDSLKEAENFWLHRFEGEIPVLDLPTNEQRPAVQSFEGNKVYASINEETKNKINTIAHSIGITPYMLMLGAYYVLLSKYSSQDDIVVGSPVVGRDIADIYNTIGMFVNTLPLRETINANLSFREFSMNIKNNLLNCYKYQMYPYDELINKLDIKRDTGRNPLYDVMFIYQNNGYKEMHFNNIKSEYYIPDTGISKLDLSLEIIPFRSGLNLSFEYAMKLFDKQFIENMMCHYINILNSILENVDTKISEINMFSDEEKNKILYEFNNTKTDYPKDKTIAQLFEEQVDKTPNNIAVVFGDKKLTYRELNEKANSLAYYLRENGIGRNDLVGILTNRSLEMIISIFAVIKAGGAYVPIDPAYPKDRIKYILETSKSKLLLTQEHLLKSIESKNTICVDLFNESIYSLCSNNLPKINKPEDLAYVIFTSGSTGLPKGVIIKQQNVVNLAFEMSKDFHFGPNDSIVSIATFAFDMFVFEGFVPFLNGLKVVIANEKEQTNVDLYNNLCIKNNVNIIHITPSRLQIFMLTTSSLDFMRNATHILIGAEMLPKVLFEKMRQFSNAKIYNMYGPTETTVWSSTKYLDSNIITIGKPIINTQIYILDKFLNPVPIGSKGEICISGDGVSNGYFNNNELTNKSFIDNPFINNSKMYKTGDIGAYTPNGDIICFGRVDNQVKIRGLRIELGEIESLVAKYPSIEKVTVVKQTINKRDCISAYYVSLEKISIDDLRKYLSQYLPKYMIPSYFVALDDLPYNPNGKIDRKALPLPSEILSLNATKYTPPKTELQRKLVDIFEKVLNTKPVGINDNFFELGGDSLLAMHLNIELQKVSTNIDYSDIFHFATVAELEERINTKDTNEFLLKKVENLSDNFLKVLNNCTKKDKIRKYIPKSVLITGCTGFLGIHILNEFIDKWNGNIYCIVREAPGITAKARLVQKLNYYFGKKYDDLIDKRIFAISGNITEPGFGLDQHELLNLANSIDVVINSAARVAHYGNYNDFYMSNVKSVKYIIDFCKSFNKKLYHISTVSVGGIKLDTSLPTGQKQNSTFDESSLYIGQVLDNVYVRTKFEAEQCVLEAIANGLDGYILRMGNLMPRYSDGIFQKNALENAFINRIIALTQIGIIPRNILEYPLEFTPIDYAAKAIYKLIQHPSDKNRIFILYNQNTIPSRKLVNILKKSNHQLDILSEEEFTKRIKNILDNDNTNQLLDHLITDFDKNMHFSYNTSIKINSSFTVKYLKKTHFKWPKISNKYLARFEKLLWGVMKDVRHQ